MARFKVGDKFNLSPDALGGIESDSGEYIEETARELAESIAERVGESTEIRLAIR